MYAHSVRMIARSRRKRSHEQAIPLNITLPPLLYRTLETIVRDKGFSGPVDYFKTRIRLDGGLELKRDAETQT